jgi:hypothetical protein
MSLTVVTFDDCFGDNISEALKLVYQYAEELNLPIARISNDDQAGFIIGGHPSHIMNNAGFIHWNGLIHGSHAHISTDYNSDELTPDWPWNEFDDSHYHVLCHSYKHDVVSAIADGYRPTSFIEPFIGAFELRNMCDFTFNADDQDSVTLDIGALVTTKKGTELQYDTVDHDLMNYYAPVGKNWVAGINFVVEENNKLKKLNPNAMYVWVVEDQFTHVQMAMNTRVYADLVAECQAMMATGAIEEEEMLEKLHLTVMELMKHYKHHEFLLTPKWRS